MIIKKMHITDYSVMFQIENSVYRLDMNNIIDYLNSGYYTDEYVGNSDSICDLVEALASEWDLIEIYRIIEEFDESIINDYEYYIIDLSTYELQYFNSVVELSEIYDLKDIVLNIIENDDLSWYCEKLSGVFWK